MKIKSLTKIFILLALFFGTVSLQSCGRKGPLKLPDGQQTSRPKDDSEMYE